MEFIDVYNLINALPNKSSNVLINTKNGKNYKQNLHINSTQFMYIRNYNSRLLGYRVTQDNTNNWESIKLIK